MINEQEESVKVRPLAALHWCIITRVKGRKRRGKQGHATEVDDALLPSHDEMPAFLHQFDAPDAAHISSTHPHVGPPLSLAPLTTRSLMSPS